MNRRNFLKTGAAGLLLPLAPAICKAEWLMPIKVKPARPIIREFYDGSVWLDTASQKMHVYQNGAWNPIHDSVLLTGNESDEKVTVEIDGTLWIDGPVEPLLFRPIIVETKQLPCFKPPPDTDYPLSDGYTHHPQEQPAAVSHRARGYDTETGQT